MEPLSNSTLLEHIYSNSLLFKAIAPAYYATLIYRPKTLESLVIRQAL
jgi:hypothetical protein